VELTTDEHPVTRLAAANAVDEGERRKSLAALRRLSHEHGNDVELFCYHDPSELPRGGPGL